MEIQRATRGTPNAPEAPTGSLEDLLDSVGRGDAEAFRELYVQLSAPVFGLVARVLRDRAQAEEVSQEVLLAVWRTASQFDRLRGSALAWVMTIAHRRAVDRVRSEQSCTDRQQRAAGRAFEPDHDTVLASVERGLDREAVRRCLATISDLQREAITLAYYGGLTYREVAEELGVALGTIKTRIRDGLRNLRNCLGVTT